MRRTSNDWLEQDKYRNILVCDPDGWDRRHFYFSFNLELITEEEFRTRLSRSTVLYKDNETNKRDALG